MAISPDSYAVGNRVYRGGSSAPTMGTVDPTGYVDRSLNQPSNSRSGLAAAALRRMGSSASEPGKRPGQPSQQGTALQGVPAGVPMDAISGVLNGVPDPAMGAVPTVRDAVRARMQPDGTYRLDVRQIQEQVAHAHDYSAAAQRALASMQPIPSVQMMNGAATNGSK